MIIPQPGRLVAVFVYDFGERLTWHSALGSVEDLFELKTIVGTNTATVAVIAVPEILADEQTDMIRVLANTFDDLVTLDSPFPPERLDLPRRLHRLGTKANLSGLWEQESVYQSEALRRQVPEGLAGLTERSRRPTLLRTKDEVFDHLWDMAPGRVSRYAYIDSIKNDFGTLRRSRRFKFDFIVEGPRPTPVDVIRGEDHGMRERLRYLSLKARLIRYQLDQAGRFEPKPAHRPLLILDGNIAGPDHDPARYMRALTRVGWNVAGQDQPNRIREAIFDENL
jgi:hypothetical protein